MVDTDIITSLSIMSPHIKQHASLLCVANNIIAEAKLSLEKSFRSPLMEH